CLGLGNQARLDPGLYCLHRVRVDQAEEVFVTNIWVWVCKQAIVETYLGRKGVFDADPSNGPAYTDRAGPWSPWFGVGDIFRSESSGFATKQGLMQACTVCIESGLIKVRKYLSPISGCGSVNRRS